MAAAVGGTAWTVKAAITLVTGDEPPAAFAIGLALFPFALLGLWSLVRKAASTSQNRRSRYLRQNAGFRAERKRVRRSSVLAGTASRAAVPRSAEGDARSGGDTTGVGVRLGRGPPLIAQIRQVGS